MCSRRRVSPCVLEVSKGEPMCSRRRVSPCVLEVS